MFQIEPILLNHERPITQIKYNREGDLLWTASKQKTINVWYSSNGERLGTYDGHNGAVFSLDVDKRTEKIVSGSGDSTTRIWSAEKGIEIARWHHGGVPVRCVQFSANATQILTLGAQVMGVKSRISLWDTSSCSNNAISEMQNGDNIRITCAYFNPNNEYVVTGNEDGTVRLFDLKKPSGPIEVVKVHEKEITQLSYSKDRVFLISASRDGKAKLLDASSFKCLKTYETGIPINSAAISPHPQKDEVAVGGGQEVASVALMGPPDKNQFAVRFFHSVYEEYIGRMAGHFGPLTYLAYHPDGSQLATGGEDGLVRVHTFPEKYFTSFKIRDDPKVLLQ